MHLGFVQLACLLSCAISYFHAYGLAQTQQRFQINGVPQMAAANPSYMTYLENSNQNREDAAANDDSRRSENVSFLTGRSERENDTAAIRKFQEEFFGRDFFAENEMSDNVPPPNRPPFRRIPNRENAMNKNEFQMREDNTNSDNNMQSSLDANNDKQVDARNENRVHVNEDRNVIKSSIESDRLQVDATNGNAFQMRDNGKKSSNTFQSNNERVDAQNERSVQLVENRNVIKNSIESNRVQVDARNEFQTIEDSKRSGNNIQSFNERVDAQNETRVQIDRNLLESSVESDRVQVDRRNSFQSREDRRTDNSLQRNKEQLDARNENRVQAVEDRNVIKSSIESDRFQFDSTNRNTYQTREDGKRFSNNFQSNNEQVDAQNERSVQMVENRNVIRNSIESNRVEVDARNGFQAKEDSIRSGNNLQSYNERVDSQNENRVQMDRNVLESSIESDRVQVDARNRDQFREARNEPVNNNESNRKAPSDAWDQRLERPDENSKKAPRSDKRSKSDKMKRPGKKNKSNKKKKHQKKQKKTAVSDYDDQTYDVPMTPEEREAASRALHGIYYGGDILLPDFYGQSDNGIDIESIRWPQGKVYYEIHESIGQENYDVITRAMKQFQDKTCIRFVPRKTEPNYVVIFKGDGCYSSLGRAGGPQPLSLGDGCSYVGTVVHELGHALGFLHEHQRMDRDNYIVVNEDNIVRGDENKLSASAINGPDTVYDAESIMHYGETAFSKSSNRETLQSLYGYRLLDPYDKPSGLSKGDIQKIKDFYSCD